MQSASKIRFTAGSGSFASHARALYVYGEKGTAQPRSLAAAFLKPVAADDRDIDQGGASIEQLEGFRDRLDAAYGQRAADRYTMNCLAGSGTLAKLKKFAVS